MSTDRFTPRRRDAERRGRRGETLAALLLMLKGYRVLGRRVRTAMGEIDLVARAPSGVLCFVEVKMRASQSLAVESLGPAQRARIVRAASLFVASRPALRAAPMRFDVVSIAPRGLPRHWRDAWRAGD